MFLAACTGQSSNSEREQLTLDTMGNPPGETDSSNQVSTAHVSLRTIPGEIVLSGLQDYQLIPVYRQMRIQEGTARNKQFSSYRSYDGEDVEQTYFYMPGISLLYGYNLVNIGHHHMKTGERKMLFDKPVLIKSLYYPSFAQDSLNKKPVNRDYYLVSVYDRDTNADTLLDRRDLRHFYYFDGAGNSRKQLLPENYSVRSSQYDSGNDVMFIYAKLDENNNGTIDDGEPTHIFWISLKSPAEAKRMY